MAAPLGWLRSQGKGEKFELTGKVPATRLRLVPLSWVRGKKKMGLSGA